MAIVCPSCSATQSLFGAEFGPEGQIVHCSRCGTTWLARNYQDDPYRRAAATGGATGDVMDAVVIDHIPPEAEPAPRQRRRDAPRRPWFRSERRVLKGRVLKGTGAVLGIVVAVMVLGVPIVAALPQLSANGLPAEVEKLEFQRVRSETVAHRGVQTLVVEGEIVNRSGSDIAIPAIRIALRSPAGAEVYSWLVEPSAVGLAPGRSIGFRSAVASPPPEASQVTLRLAQRENQIIGLR